MNTHPQDSLKHAPTARWDRALRSHGLPSLAAGAFLLAATATLATGCGDHAPGCPTPQGAGAPPGTLCEADSDCAAAGDRAGICVAGICGVAAAETTCAEDGARSGCPAGFLCRNLVLERGTFGACLPAYDCTPCQGTRADGVSCLPLPNQSCDPTRCSIPRGPELVCKTPPALGAGPYFTDVRDEVGLGDDGADVTGNRLAWADIDEDGYPELFVHWVTVRRDDLSADPPVRRKRVLRNVAGAGGARQLEEFTDASGYTATRDASGLGRAAGFAVFADVNNDGHVDIFSGTPVYNDDPDLGDRSEVLLGAGDGTFTLAPRSDTSPEERQATQAAAFLDFDLDGNVDLFVGNQYGAYGYLNTMQQNRLYQGDGAGAFTDVTVPMGLRTVSGHYADPDSHRATDGVTVCDVDSDGDPDIITSNYGRAPNKLWENLDGSSYRNIAPDVGADADDLEDYSDNQLFLCHCQLNPSAPECQPSPGTPMIQCTSDYWQVGSDDQPWRLAGTTFTTVCGDIDNDGDMDLFETQIRHWHHGLSSDPTGLLLNTGGDPWTFERPDNSDMGLARDWGSPTWDEGDITSGFLDFDNDGRLDIFLGCSDYPMTHDFLFRQLPTHRFLDVTEASGAGHYYGNGVAFADYDRDGDLDIAVGSSTMRCSSDPACTWTKAEVHLYRNDVGQDANWLAVKLVGAGPPLSNASAIGARVVVTAGGVSQTREVQGGYGHFGIGNTLWQHFGLGAECLAETVTVFWPNRSFTTTTFSWVPANYFLTIDEATDTITYEAPAE